MNIITEKGITPAILRSRQVYKASAPDIKAGIASSIMFGVKWYDMGVLYPKRLDKLIISHSDSVY
jgi:hypothetical protein